MASAKGAAIGAFLALPFGCPGLGIDAIAGWEYGLFLIGTGAVISSIEGGWEGLYNYAAAVAGGFAVSGAVYMTRASQGAETEDMMRIELARGKARASTVPPDIQEFFDNQYYKIVQMVKDMKMSTQLPYVYVVNDSLSRVRNLLRKNILNSKNR